MRQTYFVLYILFYKYVYIITNYFNLLYVTNLFIIIRLFRVT